MDKLLRILKYLYIKGKIREYDINNIFDLGLITKTVKDKIIFFIRDEEQRQYDLLNGK